MCSPIGGFIGLIFSSASELVQAVLLAIAAGTFVYVATVEIMTEQFNGNDKKMGKFVCFVLGSGFMIFVWKVE